MKTLLTTWFLFLFIFQLFPQESRQAIDSDAKTTEDKLLNLAQQANNFTHLYPQEKVFLHFDNTAYFQGDAIWFKAYVVLAQNLYPSVSKVLHVELVSPEGNLLETQKLKIENAQTDGALILARDLYPGFYEVRAYTKAMLNFGEEVVFSRVFPVYSQPDSPGKYDDPQMLQPKRKIEPPQKREKQDKHSPEINLSFYPESGIILSGMSNRIAFKVMDKTGRDVQLEGKIIDSSGNEITDFSTFHAGMGSFELFPETQMYYARFSYFGKSMKVPLPEVKASGYNLRVESMHPAQVIIQINRTPDLAAELLGLAIMCRGRVLAYQTVQIDQTGSFNKAVSRSEFPEGVLQAVLFRPTGEIIADRLFFVNQNSNFEIKPVSITSSFEPYGKIKVDIRQDSSQGVISGIFSLSVKDAASTIHTGYSDNIKTNLLLSSELKGYIADPAYYFEDDSPKRKMALDLLMLVQGWRRYDWNLLTGQEPFEVKHGIEEGLLVEGSVYSRNGKKKEKDVSVKMWMYSTEGLSQQGKCATDEEGRFNFLLTDIYGRWDMNLLAMKKDKPHNSRILLDRVFSPEPQPYSVYTTDIQGKIIKTEQPQYLQPGNEPEEEADNGFRSYRLDEITIREKAKMKLKYEGARYAEREYDVQTELDKLRDRGEGLFYNVLDFLESIDENFTYSFVPEDCRDRVFCTYRSRPVLFILNNRLARIAPMSLEPECESLEDYNNYGETDAIDPDMARQFIENMRGRIEYSMSDVSVDEIESIMISEEQHLLDLYHQFTTAKTRARNFAFIFVYTNQDGGRRIEPKGTRKTAFTGFARPVEFYSPDYSKLLLPDEDDFRRTLYWDPNVMFDANGKASIEFYNNGTCKELLIDGQGINSQGTFIEIENRK